jgi:hypothetical protein
MQDRDQAVFSCTDKRLVTIVKYEPEPSNIKLENTMKISLHFLLSLAATLLFFSSSSMSENGEEEVMPPASECCACSVPLIERPVARPVVIEEPAVIEVEEPTYGYEGYGREGWRRGHHWHHGEHEHGHPGEHEHKTMHQGDHGGKMMHERSNTGPKSGHSATRSNIRKGK